MNVGLFSLQVGLTASLGSGIPIGKEVRSMISLNHLTMYVSALLSR